MADTLVLGTSTGRCESSNLSRSTNLNKRKNMKEFIVTMAGALMLEEHVVKPVVTVVLGIQVLVALGWMVS